MRRAPSARTNAASAVDPARTKSPDLRHRGRAPNDAHSYRPAAIDTRPVAWSRHVAQRQHGLADVVNRALTEIAACADTRARQDQNAVPVVIARVEAATIVRG